MLKKTIYIIVTISILVGMFAAGWYLNRYFTNKDREQALSKSIEFSSLIAEDNIKEAHQQLPKALQDAKPLSDFSEELEIIDELNLQPGVVQTYQSGNSYITTQEFIEEVSEKSKLLSISIEKTDGEFLITAYALD